VKHLFKKQILDFQENFKNKKMEFEKEIASMMVREMFQNFSIIMRLHNSKSLLLEQGVESFKKTIKKFFEDKEESKNKSKYKNFSTSSKFQNKELPAALKNLI
jgi:ERCC4-related helicase